ncbi:hypothetical protein F7725_011124, partial [Dissostichus mawsoni]
SEFEAPCLPKQTGTQRDSSQTDAQRTRSSDQHRLCTDWSTTAVLPLPQICGLIQEEPRSRQVVPPVSHELDLSLFCAQLLLWESVVSVYYRNQKSGVCWSLRGVITLCKAVNLGLHALTPPLQQLDVPPAAAHLQPQHRAAVLHPPVHLRHGRLGQDLQDGQQLALEAAVLHVLQLLSQK